MSHILKIEYSIGLLLMFGFINATIVPACSQVLVEVPLHDFSDRNSVPLVCGKVVSFTDKAIQVQDGLKITHVLPIRNISRGDQKFIIALKKANKRSLKQEAEAIDLFNEIESGTAKNQLKSLQRIAKIGPSATSLSEDIGAVALESPNDKIAAAALQTFASICLREPSSTETLLNILNSRSDVLAIIEQDPEMFFNELVRIGPYGEPILIPAAYTGEMRFNLKKKPQAPAALPTVAGKKNSIRALACFALSQIRTASARTAALAVLKSAETPVNNQTDLHTVSRVFIGSAKGGQVITGPWSPSLNRHQESLPREVAMWRENSKTGTKAAINLSRLHALSRLRRFFDRDGNFILRGTFESFSDGLVLITDENKERVAIQFDKFSDDDKKWVREKSK